MFAFGVLNFSAEKFFGSCAVALESPQKQTSPSLWLVEKI
jgi:hypothetical protein